MAIVKNLLHASLRKKPKTFEEFQEFFFYWESDLPATEHREADDSYPPNAKYDVKEFKLILWNARKIKNLTKSEIHRLGALYQGYNCWSRYDLGSPCRMTAKERKETEAEEDYTKYKGWKDSDNPKDPKIKKLN